MDFSLLWATLVDPSKMFSMALSLVSSPPSTISQENSFYPPLDSVSFITDSTYGTFGGVFTAPEDRASPTGSRNYNYCTMPHPDPDTYQPPSPVHRGSIEAQLVYVEYVQRHQRRTPYNILSGGEVSACKVCFGKSLLIKQPGSTVQLRERSPISLCWACRQYVLSRGVDPGICSDLHGFKQSVCHGFREWLVPISATYDWRRLGWVPARARLMGSLRRENAALTNAS